jgi:hypothetical protein
MDRRRVSARRPLTASFVRTVGERDRVYVTRSDGTQASWVFPSYGDALPHDLVHLVVESAFGLALGFWGRVDAGADPAAINAEANRTGGRDKYAAFGPDRTELLLAEAVANLRWLAEDASGRSLADDLRAACASGGLPEPADLSSDRMERVRDRLRSLTRQWRALVPKGAIELAF